MRLLTLILVCTIFTATFAEPEPKKYKVQQKKNASANTTLTDEERKFLREVEAKFGIKPNGKEDDKKDDKIEKPASPEGTKLPFPAVIAIEIVNDTDTKTKGKRTIDANLGYGYKTNNGYSYSYFGKPVQDQGKFMIYPYSQKDIPSKNHEGSGHTSITHVEIQPSKAFELVTVKDEDEGYQYPKPSHGLSSNLDNVKGLASPPQSYSHRQHPQGSTHSQFPSTLYTTYNGHEFSSLSGHFPSVMPNYFVDPSQLLKTPEYQNVGLTNDHLHLPQSNIADQRVVPVLVLRVPSSSLKNPTAELFANLPANYPLSKLLNHVNIQELVNQYFKKMGFSFAPPVTHYQNAIGPSVVETNSHHESMSNYGRQHYAVPYVQPSYTQSDHSGVQYSAVQPVMAKYPSTYPQRYTLSHGHSLYQQPMLQQKYEYRYKYVPQTSSVPQTYYVQSQYPQQLSHNSVPANVPESNSHQINQISEHHYLTPEEDKYDTSPQINSQENNYKYRTSQAVDEDETAKAAAYQYIQQGNLESASPSYGHLGASQEAAQEYIHHIQEEALKEAVTSFPSHTSNSEPGHNHAEVTENHADIHNTQNYRYEQQNSEESDSNGLILSENYPSKDHTIATVFPVNHKFNHQNQNTATIQTVSYVTPMPYSSKYQSPYRIMVPQTFLMKPSTEKVSYVNSQSVSAFAHSSQQEYNPEAEYTVGPHYVPPIGKQKPASYPRNYHSHPKRMVKPDTRSEGAPSRKQHERNDHKKSS